MAELKQKPGMIFTTRLGDDNGLFDPKVPRIGEADADIKIGGDDSNKFKSVIEASKWGKYYLNIRNPFMPLRSDVKLFDNGIITIEDATKGIQEKYYPKLIKTRHGLEYEMIFNSQPPSEIRLNIEHSGGMEFYRQTIESLEGLGGAKYAPNVPGSFACYINQRNNKYRTGKFCHLYTPKFIEIEGLKRQGFAKEFWIENGEIIIVPPDWVRSATYPIILDPTIGYTSEGASYDNASRYWAVRHNSTAGADGIAQSLHFWIEDNTQGDVNLSLYDGYASGDNRLLNNYPLLQGAQSANQFNVIDVSAENFSIVNTVDYYPSFIVDGVDAAWDVVTQSAYENHAFGVLPATWPNNLAGFSRTFSMYLTYEPAAGGISLLTAGMGNNMGSSANLMTG